MTSHYQQWPLVQYDVAEAGDSAADDVDHCIAVLPDRPRANSIQAFPTTCRKALLRNDYVIAFRDSSKLLILWWAQQDSNLRLPPCESNNIWFFNNLQDPGGLLSPCKHMQA